MKVGLHSERAMRRIVFCVALLCLATVSLVVIRETIVRWRENESASQATVSPKRWRTLMQSQTPASLIGLGATPCFGLFQQAIGLWADPPPATIGLGGSILSSNKT